MQCSKTLNTNDRALFVEEEVGRIFCSEACISNHFASEIERLEKEYFRRLVSSDLSGEEREKLSHLRWITLQEPDEMWREKTLSGDYRFTLISEFQPSSKKIWCICLCLFLRGEPSFLYLAFATRNAAMVGQYRRGERVEWDRKAKDKGDGENESEPAFPTDGLAEQWTPDETFRAEVTRDRRADDVPVEEFGLYDSCLEETLENPNEVWSAETTIDKLDDTVVLHHFIRYYPNEKPGVWYVIVAREIPEDNQLEILDAFPTRDSALVNRFRTGTQEVGEQEYSQKPARVVH